MIKFDARIKKILIGLNNLEETLANRNNLRYAINVFLRSQEWILMVDLYYMPRNFEVSTLEDFFSTIKLHESKLVGLKESRTTNHNIALVEKPKEPNLDATMDGNYEAYLVRKMKFILNSNNFDRRQT